MFDFNVIFKIPYEQEQPHYPWQSQTQTTERLIFQTPSTAAPWYMTYPSSPPWPTSQRQMMTSDLLIIRSATPSNRNWIMNILISMQTHCSQPWNPLNNLKIAQSCILLLKPETRETGSHPWRSQWLCSKGPATVSLTTQTQWPGLQRLWWC